MVSSAPRFWPSSLNCTPATATLSPAVAATGTVEPDTAVLWRAYLGWESAVKEASPDANIRVDLLLIYPLLTIATLAAVWIGVRKGSS